MVQQRPGVALDEGLPNALNWSYQKTLCTID